MVWELWPYKYEGPSYVGLKPQEVKEVKVLEKKKLLFKWWQVKEDYLNNKVKWQSQEGLFNKVNEELSNYGKWL